MTYAAIPTVYKGVQFRSRLEARWAAFFDLCGFPWRYEPIELVGYIPDFLVSKDVLFEVKPAHRTVDFADACIKIDRSGWTGRAIVVGLDPSIAVSRRMHSTCVVDDQARLLLDGTWDWVESGIFANEDESWAEAGNLTQYKGLRQAVR